MGQVSIPVSVGELVDKMTILEIKAERIADPGKLENVIKELELVRGIWNSSSYATADIEHARARLKAVNEALWDIEDEIRLLEAERRFDEKFVELARAVYLKNDERAALKREISTLLDSEVVEEKSYSEYTRKEI
ncbi:MAG: DUF6165 family protein [Gammaproteobacteria bacterium]